MDVRVLQPDEFSQLAGVADGFVPDPRTSIVVGAFDSAGRIVGRMCLVPLLHLEGAWVDEAHRSHTLLKKLVDATETAAQDHGVQGLLAIATNPQRADYLARLGWTDSQFKLFKKEL